MILDKYLISIQNTVKEDTIRWQPKQGQEIKW